MTRKEINRTKLNEHIKNFDMDESLKKLIINNKKKVEDRHSFILNLKKNETYQIELTRQYDLLSQIVLGYDENQYIDFGEIVELPHEINFVIKQYLIPLDVVKMLLKAGNSSLLQIAEKLSDNNKNIVSIHSSF